VNDVAGARTPAVFADDRVERPADDVREDFVRRFLLFGRVAGRRLHQAERKVAAFEPVLLMP
jgi:hypothetical protein